MISLGHLPVKMLTMLFNIDFIEAKISSNFRLDVLSSNISMRSLLFGSFFCFVHPFGGGKLCLLGRCYDPNLDKEGLPRDVCQIWLGSLGKRPETFRTFRTFETLHVPDVSDVPNVPPHIYISLLRR